MGYVMSFDRCQEKPRINVQDYLPPHPSVCVCFYKLWEMQKKGTRVAMCLSLCLWEGGRSGLAGICTVCLSECEGMMYWVCECVCVGKWPTPAPATGDTGP